MIEIASLFLRWLDPDAESFVFQTFWDGKDKEGGNTLSGSLSEHWHQLAKLNAEGYGVSVATNAMAGDRRRTDEVTRIRAIWFDNDSRGRHYEFTLTPSITVQTSPGKHHYYWLVDGEWEADAKGQDDFRGLMQAMVELGSDGNATDLARVLRLPGTLHQKGEYAYLVTISHPIIGEEPVRYSRQQLLDAFKVKSQPKPKPVVVNHATKDQSETEWDKLKDALAFIRSDDRETWIKVGMGLHNWSGGSTRAYDLWDKWSQTSLKYGLGELGRQWNSFHDNPAGISIGTIYHLAGEARDQQVLASFNKRSIPEIQIPTGAGEATTAGLGDRALAALQKTFDGWGHNPSKAQMNALRELMLVMQHLVDGSAEHLYYLSSLDPGIGKTQAVIHFVRELLADPKYEDVAMVILLGRLAEIESYVESMNLNPEDFAVQVYNNPDNLRLNGLGNKQPNKARVLFTTQQMLESRVKKQGSFADVAEFWFNGKPRQVRLWDEACIPARPLVIDVSQIEGLTDPARRFTRSNLLAPLRDLIQQIHQADDDTLITIPLWESIGLELNDVLNVYEVKEQIDVVKDLFLLSGSTVSVHRDGQNRSFVHYENSLPDDLKPVVICDASGRVRKTYAHWADGRRDIVTLRNAPKNYDALTVHLWKHAGSKSAWKSGFRVEMEKAIVAVVNSRPDEEFLIVHHMASRRLGDIRRDLSLHIVKPDRVKWTHWQSDDCKATNQFRNIPNIILAGTLFYPTSYYEALARLSRGVKAGDRLEREVRADIEVGEHAHLILQAACRGAVRKAVDGGCGEAQVWIIASDRSGIPRLIESKVIFPGSQVLEWTPVPKEPRGQVREAIVLLDKMLKDSPDNRVDAEAIKIGIGIRDNKNFRRKVLRHLTFEEALRERSVKVRSVSGKGGGTYLEVEE